VNRRNFIQSALKAAAGFSILPSALTYARSWKPTAGGVVVPTFQQIYWESRWIPMPVAEWEAGCLDALRTPFYREYLQRSLQL
jgi:hypothetical protein